jgi:tRNA pseudouridine38-40 synthase
LLTLSSHMLPMPRYRLVIEYDGTPYSGWQRQPDAPSVQGAIERAFFQFCQQEVTLFAAGRTDAGVHAAGQVAHVDVTTPHDCFKIRNALNAWLRHEAIAITDVEEVSESFHARFDAKQRHYRYRIIQRRAPLVLEANRAWNVVHALDVEAMREAAAILVGRHNFSSFRDAQCQAKSPLRTLDVLNITCAGEHITLELSALSFLHHQVRIITGTLVDVGRGKYPAAQVEAILHARTRTAAGATAPPYGLYFMQVEYEGEEAAGEGT